MTDDLTSAPTAAVAVITRTKDRPLLLERAIKSVMQQSFADLRMVIVNDGGDPEPVDSLIAKHESIIRGRVDVIHHPHSLGMEAASNVGIRSTSSTFVVIHDDDDSWHPQFLRETTRFLIESDQKGVVTRSDRIVESIANGSFRTIDVQRFRAEVNAIHFYELCGGNTHPPIAFLYRRDALDKVGYYDESLPVLGDWDFNLRFMSYYDIGFIDRPLAYYHHRDCTGPNGNSVIAGADRHEEIRTLVLNRALREDFQHGQLSIGFVMNMLHFQRREQVQLSRRRHATFAGELKELIRDSDSLTARGLRFGKRLPKRVGRRILLDRQLRRR